MRRNRKSNSMKWNRTAILLGAFLICGSSALSVMPQSALADSEPIDLVPITVQIPEAVKDPRPVIVTDHVLKQKDVEKLARLLWSSPLRAECYKKELVWVVMNRAAHGEPFGSSIQDCITVSEFSFFDSHAHRSDENMRIVREAMNEWYSRKEGNNPGTVIRLDAYYIKFTGEQNRRLQMLDINKDPINWDPVK